MAALAAGSIVIPAASVMSLAPHRARPKIGLCESAVAGPPPTAVVVDWADGTRTTYSVSGAGATSVIFQVLNPTHALLLGSVVQIPAVGNPGGRMQGVVVMHFNIQDPSGGNTAELVIIETPTGFQTAPYANVTVVDAA